ncbi:uncharacterized protein LOC119575102 [Penaeus monodon]|uniref:uncharacterized protein LOC119575102 n=1 Tax=Penaeus monodon TaxID=6687 RepID=UPI0018A6ED87|nr:uncharacterized protein LOC119575102 [Penaeus monodon]
MTVDPKHARRPRQREEMKTLVSSTGEAEEERRCSLIDLTEVQLRDTHMSPVSLQELWCQCQGNASATPHLLIIQQKMLQLHEEAQSHVVWYVLAVLALYLLGLALIIGTSARSERLNAHAALCFCLRRFLSAVITPVSKQGERQQQENPKSAKGLSSPTKERSSVSVISRPSFDAHFRCNSWPPERVPRGTMPLW